MSCPRPLLWAPSPISFKKRGPQIHIFCCCCWRCCRRRTLSDGRCPFFVQLALGLPLVAQFALSPSHWARCDHVGHRAVMGLSAGGENNQLSSAWTSVEYRKRTGAQSTLPLFFCLFLCSPPLLGGTGASSPRRTFAFLISAMENPEGTVKITHVFESRPFFFSCLCCCCLHHIVSWYCHTLPLPHLATPRLSFPLSSIFQLFFFFFGSQCSLPGKRRRASPIFPVLTLVAPTLSFSFTLLIYSARLSLFYPVLHLHFFFFLPSGRKKTNALRKSSLAWD